MGNQFLTTTLSYTGSLPDSATVIKDYGAGETYRIELDIDTYMIWPIAEGYTATVYGGGYTGESQVIEDLTFSTIPLFCN
jgi:hypothetical protein